MQKFKKGDWVQIAKDLGRSMTHFTADCEAIVVGSYKDQYGGSDTKSYTLYLKNQGKSSWYEEHQLTLIESGRLDKLKEWEDAEEAERKEKSDLDWIFTHGKEVLEHPHGASIASLAKCFGLTNLWGSHGEGFVYYENARKTLAVARSFLEMGDKDGWLAHCALRGSL
jgi:ribosomal protein S24E